MASDNNRRVELRLSLSQGGLRGTPEHIESLRLRQREADRLASAGAPGAFDRLMTAGGAPPAAATATAAPRRPLGPTPRPGRRPGGARVGVDADGDFDDLLEGDERPDDNLSPGPFLVRA